MRNHSVALNACVSRLPIPETPDGLTAEWLTAALTASGVLTDERVLDARWERVGAEFGFTGVVVRIELEYERGRADLPSSLVAKLPMAKDNAVSGYRVLQERDPALMRRYYERCAREERFYREIGADCAPRLYYSAADDAQSRVVLLLEDLSAGRQGDVLEGCSIDEAALVVDELAVFHARWWGERAPASGFASLWRDPVEWQERYERRVDLFLDRFTDRAPPALCAAASLLRSRLADVARALHERTRSLTHGDLHLDNVVFDARAERSVVVLDWQGAALGPPAWDVAYFLCDSLSVDDRRAAEAGLLERYVELLAEHGATDYPVEVLRREIPVALLAQLAGTVGWLSNLDETELTDREHALQEAVLGDGRLLAALVDHDAEALLAGERFEKDLR
jgi:streptomycin 6-kinase